MNCQQIKKDMEAYIRRSLNHGEKKLFELHLCTCEKCSQALDALIEAKLDSGKIELVRPPFYPPIELLDRFFENATKEKANR